MNGARGTEDDGARTAGDGRGWEASVAVGAVPLVAQGPGVIIAAAVVALLLLVALFFVLRQGDEQLEEQERPEIEEGERPTDDLLEEREEVDEPVEDYEDMSLAEIKKAKMARVEGKGEGRETAGEATERAREEHVEDEEPEAESEAEEAETDKSEADDVEEEESGEEESDEEPEDEAEEPAEEETDEAPEDEAEEPAEEETDEAAEDDVVEAEAPEEDEEDEDDDEGGFGLPSPGEVSEASDAEAEDESDEDEDEGSSGEGLPTPSSFAEDTEDDEQEEDEEQEDEEQQDEDEERERNKDEESADGGEDEDGETDPSEAAAEEGETADEDADERAEADEDDAPDESDEDEAESDDEDGGDGGEGSGGAPGEAEEPADDESEDEEERDASGEEETSADADEELPEDIDDAEAEPKSFEKGLEKTREGFIQQLSSLFSGEELSEEMVEEVEQVLFSADIGPRVAQDILDAIEEQLSGEELDDPGKVWGFIRHYTEELLEAHEEPLDPTSSDPPFVALVVGVNGVGKTTTIGKMASRFKRQGHSVLLVAGDTYRAAAVDQLGIWAERTGLPMHSGDEGADPASVIYSGIERAVEEDIDVVLCDTSGRLHTDVNLMEELEKMERVAGNAKEGAPDEVHLVLDANTGQNAIQQAEKFNESLDVSGITLTKFDGTARGGVILGVCKRFDAPIRYVGIGERVVDLREFDAGEFVEALFM